MVMRRTGTLLALGALLAMTLAACADERVEQVEVGAAPVVFGPDVEVLVVGGPTHAFGMTRPTPELPRGRNDRSPRAWGARARPLGRAPESTTGNRLIPACSMAVTACASGPLGRAVTGSVVISSRTLARSTSAPRSTPSPPGARSRPVGRRSQPTAQPG